MDHDGFAILVLRHGVADQLNIRANRKADAVFGVGVGRVEAQRNHKGAGPLLRSAQHVAGHHAVHYAAEADSVGDVGYDVVYNRDIRSVLYLNCLKTQICERVPDYAYSLNGTCRSAA